MTNFDAASYLKNVRVVSAILDVRYDKDKKGYTDGYSDKRVADETKVSVQAVQEIRKELYGPLADAEVTALITDFRDWTADFESRIKKLEAKRMA